MRQYGILLNFEDVCDNKLSGGRENMKGTMVETAEQWVRQKQEVANKAMSELHAAQDFLEFVKSQCKDADFSPQSIIGDGKSKGKSDNLMTKKDTVLAIVTDSQNPVRQRDILKHLSGMGMSGTSSSVATILKRLMREGKIARLSRGVYIPKKKEIGGSDRKPRQ
jgi:hypothetical protein